MLLYKREIMKRCAKIVATIGPASNQEDNIRQLLQAGMSVARINFSHGTQDEHAASIALIRRVAKELGRPITILQDLQGPKIRTGKIEGDDFTSERNLRPARMADFVGQKKITEK